LLLIIWTANQAFCQDFGFTWRISPSLAGPCYGVKIVQSKNKRVIQLQEDRSGLKKTIQIEKKDCDSLISFLNQYEFPDKSSNIIEGPKHREYLDYKLLSDSSWIVIANDTVRREYLDMKFLYDHDLKKYYQETQSMSIFTDGTMYEGEFTTPNEEKRYSIYCAKLADKDHVLNDMIYSFVIKYFKKDQYKYLGKMIENDKPKKDIN
jgi:hypothetical protein